MRRHKRAQAVRTTARALDTLHVWHVWFCGNAQFLRIRSAASNQLRNLNRFANGSVKGLGGAKVRCDVLAMWGWHRAHTHIPHGTWHTDDTRIARTAHRTPNLRPSFPAFFPHRQAADATGDEGEGRGGLPPDGPRAPRAPSA